MREHLPAVRILIVGSGDRLAALQADSIGLTGAATAARPAICSPSGSSVFGTRPVSGSTSWSEHGAHGGAA